MYHLSKVILIIFCLAGAIVMAEVPQLINYQGRLTNPDGSLVVDGDYQIAFAIYDQAIGGTMLWNCPAQTVSIGNGMFTYQLGSVTPFLDDFFELDTQACQVFYDEPTVTGIPMWFEFSKNTVRPKRRFYFDVPPGLENAIRKDGDIIGEKQKHFANVAIYKKIGGLMRLLTLQIDLDWVARIQKRSIG